MNVYASASGVLSEVVPAMYVTVSIEVSSVRDNESQSGIDHERATGSLGAAPS